MSDNSFHLPGDLKYGRSRSRSSKGSPPRRRHYAPTPYPLGPSSAISSDSPRRFVVPEQGLNATTDSRWPPDPVHRVDPQNSTGHLFVNNVLDGFVGRPSYPLQPVTAIDAESSNSVQLIASPFSAAQPSAPQFLTNPTDFIRLPAQSSVSHHPTYSPPSSRQSLNYQNLTTNGGIFTQAHDFNVTGTFVDSSVTYNYAPPNQFMERLLANTIPGAEFDSSARDPPPRCHPGTRLAILERCLDFIRNCDGVKKMRWVVGAAGVGKSAVMQSVAESPLIAASCASVFFSIIGRNDGIKTIITLSYQLAAKSEAYRQVIEREITCDPSLLRSSMAKQFNKLIVEPFTHNPQLKTASHAPIIIDGLDECDHTRAQLELLRLIADFCIKFPSSPLIWLIASRPEAHITSFFSKADVIPIYEKEEIHANSDEARLDVEQFLRHELKEIKKVSDSLDPQWPDEQDFWKLANASSGLFAYAHTVIRYIGDWGIGSPASQLSDVLHVIDEHPMTDMSREEHPMALLDALYDRILSNVPSRIMLNTRKLLLALASRWDTAFKYAGTSRNFVVLCNWLGMTPEEAYAAINQLRSALYVPRRDKAHEDQLLPCHKSFIDYVSDFTRSHFSPDIQHEAHELKTRCALRILDEAPDGINFDEVNYNFLYGILARGPGTGDKISLTWPVGDGVGWKDDETRLSLYKLAIGEVTAGMTRGDPIFQSESCVRLLITRFKRYRVFRYHVLHDLVFDESRRHEFMMQGILNQMPLKAASGCATAFKVKLRFRRSATSVIKDLLDPWNSTCNHQREGKWEEGKDQDWTTYFLNRRCTFCFKRLERQVAKLKTDSLNHTVPILFTSTGDCCVEIRFVDLEGGIEEWTYLVWCRIPLEERRKYGSIV